VLHLTDNGLQDSSGELSAIVDSPAHTGADAGEYCAIWLGPELPGDQRRDDALSTCFDTGPLEHDLEICGAPALKWQITSDTTGQIAIRLNHIHPDGASTRITYGVLNLAHRNGSEAPEEMPKGKVQDVALQLDHIAYKVPAGHKLRIAISNAYWPLIWPSAEQNALELTQGWLSLPLITTSKGWTFPEPDAAPPWQIETLREEKHIRRQETDMVTGAVSLIIEDDFGKVRDLEHGLINGSVARELWRIHPDDPLCAYGQCHWSDELERGDVCLSTEARCEMHSDATTFYLSARLEAYENGILIFHKDVKEEIPRSLM
jgi:hypothetical protein